ncbi:transposase [Anoxybacillus thermarum]|nr:transposase [Anoxybacillus thermarum]
MCDLCSHHPVALLPNRLPQTLTEWLKTYSHVQVMSRDGFTGFRQGIANANPSILQVYDRWHFIGNAKKRLDFLLLSLVPSVMTWSESNTSVREIEMTKAEKRKKQRQEQKWALIQEIQTAHQSGKNISKLAKEYELDRKTVKKYLQLTTPPPIHRRKRKTPISPFLNRVIELEAQGHTIPSIDSLLRKEGYSGTFSAVRTSVEKIRRNRKRNDPSMLEHRISRKQLAYWIWTPRHQLSEKEIMDLEQCLESYSNVRPIYEMVQDYREAIRQADYHRFLRWLRHQLSDSKQPFYPYARRLRSDLQAVKHAFLLPYSNGVLEGQINRLKTIKRMMYGRAGLALLEKRVLYRL